MRQPATHQLLNSISAGSSQASGFFGAHASRVTANGYSCLPVPLGKKQIYLRKWTRFCSEPPSMDQVDRWLSGQSSVGLAIACGWSVVAVDIDHTDVETADEMEQIARQVFGDTPLRRVGQHPKRLLVYAVAKGHVIPSTSCSSIDMIGDNRYFVAFNVHNKTGQPYLWGKETPATIAVNSLPNVTPAMVSRFFLKIAAITSKDHASDEGHAFQATESSSARPSQRAFRCVAHDGRDKLLTSLVWHHYATCDNPENIADSAWRDFVAQADLSRPKRAGRRPWSFADALSKARALVASGKAKPPALNVGGDRGTYSDWSAVIARFRRRIDQLCIQGELTRTDRKVSHAMLGFVTDPGRACFASCDTIAAQVGCRPSSVKKARRQLRHHGVWTATHVKGGRGLLAHYRPCIEDLCVSEVGNA